MQCPLGVAHPNVAIGCVQLKVSSHLVDAEISISTPQI
jgi:hypothetical protein